MCACAVQSAAGISVQWDYRHSNALHRCVFKQLVWVVHVKRVCAHTCALTFCAYTHEHVCKCLCLLMPWGAHALLGSECYSPLLGATARPRRFSLLCNWAAHRRAVVEAWGWRFPVLPMLLGVNTGVKHWVTAQCGCCECSPTLAVIVPLHSSQELVKVKTSYTCMFIRCTQSPVLLCIYITHNIKCI